jgi:hypothetical protein
LHDSHQSFARRDAKRQAEKGKASSMGMPMPILMLMYIWGPILKGTDLGPADAADTDTGMQETTTETEQMPANQE